MTSNRSAPCFATRREILDAAFRSMAAGPRVDLREWLQHTGSSSSAGTRALIPVAACGGTPRLRAIPRRGCPAPFAIVLLELSGEKISSLTYFLDTQTLFPRFGLPPRWSES